MLAVFARPGHTPLSHAALAALLAAGLAGCGGSASGHGETTPASEPELDIGNRSFGADCSVTYEPEGDLTIVVQPWSDELMLGFVLPGDGWEGVCSDDPDQLLHATADSGMRIATVTVDRTATGDVDVEEYANAQLAATVERMRAEGVELIPSAPQHAGRGVYLVAIRVPMDDGRTLLQVNAHHVIPTASGLLRYHLSEIGDDPDTMSAHAAVLMNAVRAFALSRP
ncbi:MAG: hypothetical protein KC593_02085 [Myxococcales bacterium]|nr:hypothetical protein [Myxococcales bacterium]MCB9627739.1 hypothetical protein [Sandaracinaceae bacterium]